jgi:hypothetical protein
MSYFDDADDVYATVGRMLESATADADLGIGGADTVVRWDYHDPEATITLGLRPGEESRVDFGPTDQDAEIVLTSDADVAHRFWLGEVSVPIALARGEMTASGPSAKILELIPRLRQVFPRYRALLAEQGREDPART